MQRKYSKFQTIQAFNDITLRSGFTILDVTDPESAPEIVAEITHPDLGKKFTQNVLN